MTHIIRNPYAGNGIDVCDVAPIASGDHVLALLEMCPLHKETPLHSSPALARLAGVECLWIKDERTRMGLGSFKALGAAFVIAREAALLEPDDWSSALTGRTFITASAGNHGLSVAAGARVFGAKAVIYLSETVPTGFQARLGALGAQVVVEGTDYEASMSAALARAEAEGWYLLSDSSWDGYFDPALRVMEGYVQMAAEATRQVPQTPTHILLQAGVGGMAAAIAAHARSEWKDAPEIIVVEPDAAPALMRSIEAGRAVTTEGPVSSMGRLDCKTPSLIALKGLSRDANLFATITEDQAAEGIATLAAHGFDTTPSGGAGLAALLAGLELPADARVLTFMSEGSDV